ncbi:MAG: gamma-glutamyl-gamma-aminobutyrate hydrolase family protein [Candidatus Dormibacteria bacterium]
MAALTLTGWDQPASIISFLVPDDETAAATFLGVSAPIIAVTLGNEPRQGRAPQLAQHRSYFEALEREGAVPLGVPLLSDVGGLRRLYERCDGLLLPGGPDVAPELYAQVPDGSCGVYVDPPLDRVEMELLRWAIKDDRAVLGICRGLQLLNVCCGGTLWQDLRVQNGATLMHQPNGGRRVDLSHGLALEPDSRLHLILGSDHVEVNSLHHQGIRRLGNGLAVAGRSGDGLVEAVEMPDRRFVIALQSHPEELSGTPGWAELLFRAFVAAAAV